MTDNSAWWRARIELLDRQRKFEWQLALAEGHAAGVITQRNHAHDLRNMVQVLELGLTALERFGGAPTPETKELLGELRTAVSVGKATVEKLTGTLPAHDEPETIGIPIADAAHDALALVRAALPESVELVDQIVVEPSVRTECTAAEIEEIIGRALLDSTSGQLGAGRLSMTVRERRIEGRRWVELLCEDSSPAATDESAHAVIGLVAARVGAEVTTSATRGGGVELVVAFPAF